MNLGLARRLGLDRLGPRHGAGPRPPTDVADEAGGGFQFVAIAAEVKLRLPSSWAGQPVTIRWRPAPAIPESKEVLFFLFVPEPSSGPLPSIDSATSSAPIGGGPDHTFVDNAPEWVEARAVERRRVPIEAPALLLLKPSGGAGRAVVRLAT